MYYPSKRIRLYIKRLEQQLSFYKKIREELSKKDLEGYKKLIIDTNLNFEESIKFNNKFNRLITYTGKDFHKCNSFYTGKEERLTLVFFIKKIQCSSYPPLQRSERQLIKFT